MPDVAALAGGDIRYTVLNADYVNGTAGATWPGGGGTSVASPLWASLTTQFNVIFRDQGLPNLGYYNDLLYIASVIAPGSFNDIQLGNNITGFYTTAGLPGFDRLLRPWARAPDRADRPWLFGHAGLRPDERARHAQRHAAGAGADGDRPFAGLVQHQPGDARRRRQGGWRAAPTRRCCSRRRRRAAQASHVDVGSHATDSSARTRPATPGRAGWRSSRCRPTSIPAWSCCSTGSPGRAGYGERRHRRDVRVHIDGATAGRTRPSLSNPFGFADFFASGDAVRVARPVAVAETVGGQDDQLAVVRMRQGGENSLQLTFYKVDDLAGTIDGKAPGHADYAAAGGACLPDLDGGQRHHRAGLRPVQPDAAAGRRCQRHHRHAPGQPQHRRLLLGLRPRQRAGRRPVRRSI